MIANVPTTILRNLLTNDEFTRKTIPFLKKEYFEGAQRFVFDEILKFVSKYNKLPTPEALSIELDNANHHQQTLLAVHERRLLKYPIRHISHRPKGALAAGLGYQWPARQTGRLAQAQQR